jgi:hypothetical protein
MENVMTRLPFWNWIAGSSGKPPLGVKVRVSVPWSAAGYAEFSVSVTGWSCPDGTAGGTPSDTPRSGGNASETAIPGDVNPPGLLTWISPDPGTPSKVGGKWTTAWLGAQESGTTLTGVAGVIELSVGAGAGVMRNSAAFENVLPPADTSISAVPAVAINAPGTAAVSCVELSSAVVRACAFHRTVAPARKLDPVTVSVTDEPPAVTEVGDRAVIAGVPFTERVRLFDVGNPARDTDTASVVSNK